MPIRRGTLSLYVHFINIKIADFARDRLSKFGFGKRSGLRPQRQTKAKQNKNNIYTKP